MLSEKFFEEIISHPVPLDMNILKALTRSALGLGPVRLAQLPGVRARVNPAG